MNKTRSRKKHTRLSNHIPFPVDKPQIITVILESTVIIPSRGYIYDQSNPLPTTPYPMQRKCKEEISSSAGLQEERSNDGHQSKADAGLDHDT